ncbi:MAG: 6-carboxy-5,6,7,8-tetrahydropterin synthase [Dehalococcoidia bacterium]|nr:6-carboxy-5,6,7,8-tetrahydropterin synthase [Chloroflexota bacterium]
MYRVSVRQHFDAAHYLRGYQGKCEQMHGHRFEAVVTVETSELDDVGMAFDFSELKGHLREVLGRFDHVCLNNVAPFDKINPSSENIAATIHRDLQPRLEAVSIFSVEVWESPESCATYIPCNCSGKLD